MLNCKKLFLQFADNFYEPANKLFLQFVDHFYEPALWVRLFFINSSSLYSSRPSQRSEHFVMIFVAKHCNVHCNYNLFETTSTVGQC
jgi:hypothetical protein